MRLDLLRNRTSLKQPGSTRLWTALDSTVKHQYDRRVDSNRPWPTKSAAQRVRLTRRPAGAFRTPLELPLHFSRLSTCLRLTRSSSTAPW